MARKRQREPDAPKTQDDPTIEFDDMSDEQPWTWTDDEWLGMPPSVRRLYIKLMWERCVREAMSRQRN